jgi:hypothetical protein
MSISIANINGTDHGRLNNVLIGRSEFESFGVDSSGRTLTVWIMSAEARTNLEAQLGARPAPPAPDDAAFAVPTPKLVPVRTGEQSSEPGPRPEGR